MSQQMVGGRGGGGRKVYAPVQRLTLDSRALNTNTVPERILLMRS